MPERPMGAVIEPSYDAEHVARVIVDTIGDDDETAAAWADAVRAIGAERDQLREALGEAVGLLDNARCDLTDPALRRAWGRQRKAMRSFVTPPPAQ